MPKMTLRGLGAKGGRSGRFMQKMTAAPKPKYAAKARRRKRGGLAAIKGAVGKAKYGLRKAARRKAGATRKRKPVGKG